MRRYRCPICQLPLAEEFDDDFNIMLYDCDLCRMSWIKEELDGTNPDIEREESACEQ
jgi:hypothetical protein